MSDFFIVAAFKLIEKLLRERAKVNKYRRYLESLRDAINEVLDDSRKFPNN